MGKLMLLFSISLLVSCATLEKNVSNPQGVPLTAENLHLLNGTYKRNPVNSPNISKGYDQSNLFRCFYLKPDRYGWTDSLQNDFVKIEVIQDKKVKITLLRNGHVEKSKALKGKLVQNTFEFNKRFFLIPLLFINFAETRKTRVELLQNGNLLIDTSYQAIANFLIFPWELSNYGDDLEFEKVE